MKRTAPWLLVIVAVVAIARAEPNTGTVVISCNETDATLLVDGVLIPERAPAILTLPVGSHTIEARKPTLVPDKKVVDVKDQQQTKIRFELLPPAPAAPLPPLDTGSGAGSGSAAAAGSGSGSGSAVAAVATGSAAPKPEPPRPPPAAGGATVEIATSTPHGLAYLDGAPMREAPCTLEVEPGEHVVAVYAKGMVPAEIVINVKQGERQQIQLNASRPRKKLDVP